MEAPQNIDLNIGKQRTLALFLRTVHPGRQTFVPAGMLRRRQGIASALNHTFALATFPGQPADRFR
jgi:hypothetical protein